MTRSDEDISTECTNAAAEIACSEYLLPSIGVDGGCVAEEIDKAAAAVMRSAKCSW